MLGGRVVVAAWAGAEEKASRDTNANRPERNSWEKGKRLSEAECRTFLHKSPIAPRSSDATSRSLFAGDGLDLARHSNVETCGHCNRLSRHWNVELRERFSLPAAPEKRFESVDAVLRERRPDKCGFDTGSWRGASPITDPLTPLVQQGMDGRPSQVDEASRLVA